MKRWTDSEISEAINYIKWQSENFGTPEATAIIESLLKKYNLNPEYFMAPH